MIKRKIGPEKKETYLEFLSLPIYKAENENEGTLRIGVDVTENEKLQQKLREKEKLFTSIINTTSDAVIFLDEKDQVMSWNKGAEAIFGYKENEIKGDSVTRLIPRELIEMGEQEYIHQELKTKGSIKKYETQRLHKSGRLIYVDISCSRIYDEESQFTGTSEIIKDISSRKELEFELLRTILELSKINELNEILHTTFEEKEILRIILIAITAGAGEGLRFNRAFLLLLNKQKRVLNGELAIGPSDQEEASRIWKELNKDHRYLKDIIQTYKIDLGGADKKVNEIVGQINVPLESSDHLLVKSLNQKRVYQIKNGKLTDSEPFSLEIGEGDLFQLLKNDSFVVAPLYSKKESLGLIIADNCISQREITNEDVESLKLFANQASSAIENARLYQTLEERIQELQKAYKQLEEHQEKLVKAERLAAIGEVAAKIAHEIRNPLVSIGGFARLINKRIEEDSSIKQYAEIIGDQVSHLESILNNILTIANPPKPQKRSVNVNKIIEQVILVLQNAFEGRNIKLVTDLQMSEHFIVGDEMLLHQAFLNLLKNAIEALEGKAGEKEIRIITQVDNDWIKVNICDNGSGIESNVMNEIFKSFFTTKSRGTGLGLTIVNHIVKSHGGKIDVDSQCGIGTTFSLSFPVVSETRKMPKSVKAN